MNINNKVKDLLRPLYGPVLQQIRRHKKNRFISQDVNRVASILESSDTRPRVFYLGITAHSNLGDMAQYYCIHNWIESNYPDYNHIEIEANTVVSQKFGMIKLLKEHFRPEDIVIFQSGYTTQDLGGVHDLMHREIIKALPGAKILMMPQTVFFKNPENEHRSAEIYNSASGMLFLARDKVSYEKAKQMMPDITVRVFPDIVTSLIGTLNFTHERKGIHLCRRNDGEKFYSEAELENFTERLRKISDVTTGDTTLDVPFKTLRDNREHFIKAQIEEYSKFELVITDRYHGTIFSLAAGTPVIIIKTNDHKVVTGADWFRGVYDEYVYVARDLRDAEKLAEKILNQKLNHILKPHFAHEYYDKLKQCFETLR